MDGNGQHLEALRRSNDPDLITRLANVTYWAGCMLALGWLAVCLYARSINMHVVTTEPVLDLASIFGGAAAIWMIGRAIRYVVTGK